MLSYRTNGFRIISTVIFILIIAFGAWPASASNRSAVSATISVNILIDEYNDTTTGCSLREAIRAANENTPFGGCTGGSGADIIFLPAGTYTLTRTGASEDATTIGDLDILDTLTLRGAGQDATIIDASELLDRILDIDNAVAVTLEDLTLYGGTAPSGANGEVGLQGGYGANGGAIMDGAGTLMITRTTFSQNLAGSGGHGGSASDSTTCNPGGGGGWGGAISKTGGNLLIRDSLFSHNNSGNGGEGGDGYHAAASASNRNGCTGYWAGEGGAIAMLGGTLLIDHTSFEYNMAGNGGAGGYGGMGSAGSPGVAGGVGGNGGNGGTGGRGGAIYLQTNAYVEILNSEFKNNRSGTGGNAGPGGIGGSGGAGLMGNPATPGGNGGNGGNGGSPLTGGDGGAISIYNSPVTISVSYFEWNATGNGGQGGSGGMGGNGGTGGNATAGEGAAGGIGGIGGNATQASSGGDGGAISIYLGSTTITNSTFYGNGTGSGAYGGIGGSGGAGGNGGTGLTTGGPGGEGGRAAYLGGNGGGGGDGGAISIYSYGTITLTNLTIDNNYAGNSSNAGDGGSGGNGGNGGSGTPQGIGGKGGNAGSGGDAGTTGYGAGINTVNGSNPLLYIAYNTITRNSIPISSGARGEAGLPGSGGSGSIPGASGETGFPGDPPQNGLGGGIARDAGTVYITATILADNQAIRPDCYSAYMNDLVSGGWNLFGSADGTGTLECPVFQAEDDQFSVSNVSLNLGALQLNWRSPLTRALLSGSIAIDYVQPGEANCDGTVAFDARGVRRPVITSLTPYADKGCDVGAFEFGSMMYLPLQQKP